MWVYLAWFSVGLVAVLASERSILFEILKREAELRYAASGTILTPEELDKRVAESLQRAADLLDLEVPIIQDTCEIDFSAFCPEGWISSGDGVHCEVLPWHSGASGICGPQIEMRDKSPLEKLNLMRLCDIRWPCLEKEPNVPDTDEICPKYWNRRDDECVAEATYMGPCDTALKFKGKSKTEREELALKCRVKFGVHPHLVDADSDWKAQCPLGWLHQETGVCAKALDQSPGRCGRTLMFDDLDDKLKKTKACGFLWPPRNNEVQSHCPLGWKLDQDTQFCFAPSSYTGPCQLRLDFSHYSPEDKAIWAHVCGVSFIDAGTGAPEKPSEDVTYRSGALDHNLSVVRFSKTVDNVALMERQLTELSKLRKRNQDPLFLRTLEKTIAALKSQIKEAAANQPHTFLQLGSMVLTPEREVCPYGWRQFGSICVASETYRLVVPTCKTIRQVSDTIEDRCRVAERTENPAEDFVRPYCPVGWKTRQVYFHNLVRHLCVAPVDFKETQKHHCGGSSIYLASRSPGFKRRWAFACGQRFPEFGDKRVPRCMENFYWQCPAEWSVEGSKCIAPVHYQGPCPRSVELADIPTEIEKAEFSSRCHAPWLCIGQCNKNYEQDCPDGWTREGNGCILVAPSETSRCGRNIAIMAEWSRSHKEELEFLCDVHWPCKSAKS